MVAAVQKQTTVEAGVSVLAQSIHSQIKQVFTGVILPAPIKDQVDCIFEAIEEAKGKIAAVLLANTPYSHVNRERLRLTRNSVRKHRRRGTNLSKTRTFSQDKTGASGQRIQRLKNLLLRLKARRAKLTAFQFNVHTARVTSF